MYRTIDGGLSAHLNAFGFGHQNEVAKNRLRTDSERIFKYACELEDALNEIMSARPHELEERLLSASKLLGKRW